MCDARKDRLMHCGEIVGANYLSMCRAIYNSDWNISWHSWLYRDIWSQSFDNLHVSVNTLNRCSTNSETKKQFSKYCPEISMVSPAPASSLEAKLGHQLWSLTKTRPDSFRQLMGMVPPWGRRLRSVGNNCLVDPYLFAFWNTSLHLFFPDWSCAKQSTCLLWKIR